MVAFKKLLAVFVVFAALFTSVFASPITVEDLNIQENNGNYNVIVTLANANVASGMYDELSFTIEELGTSKSVGVLKVDTNESVLSYNLKAVTDSFDLLKKGETYRLTASTSANSVSEAFLYGTEADEEGLGLVVENVEVNGEELADNDELQVLNGQQLTVKLRFTALEDFDDARLNVFIEGYEHSTLMANSEIFAVSEGKTYIKELSISLPADMNSQKDYKLRITGANDLSGFTYKEYTLFVDTQRHRVDILDLVMTPSSGVEAGQNIIANVRLKNRGQKDQDSVKVIVSIPDMGISESSYISNLGSDEVVTSDDMLLFVPDNAEAGQHEVQVKLAYDDGYTTSTEIFQMTILAPKVSEEKNLLVSFSKNVELEAGKATSFEVVVANPNDMSKPISVVPVDAVWADVEVSPSLVMIQGQSSEVFKVTVTPKKSVAGEKEVVLAIKEGSNTISEVKVSSYVEGKEDINWVNVALTVLLVIAIIILLSLVITISRRKSEKSDDEFNSTEEYY